MNKTAILSLLLIVALASSNAISVKEIKTKGLKMFVKSSQNTWIKNFDT